MSPIFEVTMNSSYKNLEPFYPFKAFNEVAESVLKVLRAQLQFDLWMVTKVDRDDWIVLAAEDYGYDVHAGDVFAWSDSFCYRMTRGLGPYIAPNAHDVPVYASSPIARQIPIGAYIGLPLIRSDGSLFGTLSAIHPRSFAEGIKEEVGFITNQARLLSTFINAEWKEKITSIELEEIKLLSKIDGLTGLYNRRSWKYFLEVEEQRCKRYSSIASIIFIDIDDLKIVNDEQGHGEGDAILSKTASCLSSLVRPFDVVCRYGGDEFTILVAETSVEATAILLTRIRDALKKEKINASLGWATRTTDITLEEVTQMADRRMYEDKRKKK